MNKINKTIDELLQELNELRQENAILKNSYKNGITASGNLDSESFLSELGFENTINFKNDKLSQEDEREIRKLFDDYLEMYASRDDRLTEYFSDNFSGFTGGGDFLVKDKTEWVAITRQDFAQVKDPLRIELKDLAIQLLSETIAVTTGFFIIHLPIEDHILSRETARLVLIFRKEENSWKISHSSISIPYYLVREGEVYPMKELVERNQLLEELVAERTIQLSETNDKLHLTNDKLEREIAGHKQAEDALQQSSQKWEGIISASPDGIGMITLDGKIQLISDKLVEMHGYNKEEKSGYLGKSVFDFIDPSNHQLLIDNTRKLLTGESNRKISEYTAIKKDNSRFYIDVNSTVLFDSENKPSSILYVQRDITERRLAEEALQQSNQKLEAIISASPDGIGMISLDGKIQLMSDKLMEIYGYSVEEKNEIIGKSSFDFIDPSNHKMLLGNIRKLIDGKSDNKLTEYLAIKKDGNRFYIDVNSTVLFDTNGNPSSILFVERDITERKQTELIIQMQNNQLKELNLAKDKFFSIISHDLRSPFQGLIGLTGLMAEDVESFSSAELSKLSGQIHKTVNNLYKLLKNLLEWSQMQQGIMSFSPQNYSLSEIVKQVIDSSHQTAVQKKIKIINSISDQIRIYADGNMVNSILHNLLSNALKFSNQGGEVILNAKKLENEMVEISVSDNGIGMSDKTRNKLFNIEEKVGRKGTEGEDSTGLGLLLCKEFVEKHGGSIWVESQENKGSVFYIKLPLYKFRTA
ncbi:MAG: hypothetical protein A2068_00815 [Ignavibacteria bacterium GWB2_35_6b]|nr:MAG: hypothetical protein A2068_00815 [Ignavibacteria bacterium GWB2_35_6b]